MGEAIGGIGSAVGGIAGLLSQAGARGSLQDALNNYRTIDPSVHLNTSISGDPQTQAAQTQLLQQTLARARAGGLNASDVANVNNILGTAGQAARQAQAGAMSQAQQQGTAQGNSGILGALVAGQNAANQASNQGMNAANIANQAAIANTAQGAQQAGALRGQNIGVEQGNVERNQQQQNQNKANEFARAAGMSGAAIPVAQQGNINAQNIAGLGGAAGNIGGGLWDYFNPYKKQGGGGGSSGPENNYGVGLGG